MDGDMASLRARVGQVEALLKAKDREVEKLGRQLEAARAAEYEAVAQKLQVSTCMEYVGWAVRNLCKAKEACYGCANCRCAGCNVSSFT